jgi:hypothetical protein
MTRVLFDGLTSHDVIEFQQYLRATVGEFLHPFALLTFIIELLNSYYIAIRHQLEIDIVGLEKTLGITRGHEGFHGWKWNPDTLRNYTQRVYRLTTVPVYLERRLVFLTSLGKFLSENLNVVFAELPSNFAGKTQMATANKAQAEAIDNILYLVTNQLHQTRCLDKRLSNLMNTVLLPSPGFIRQY